MNQPQPPQFSIAELGARFGAQQAQAYAEIITLEKQIAAQALTIQAMTKNEASLVDRIQDLEAEAVTLKAENMEREAQMEQTGLSPELVEIAAGASALIEEAYEEAEAAAALGSINA